MAVEIRVPEMGESIVEATVGRWLKQEGEPVAAGEPVVELETEKVNVEVTASEAGVLGKILKPEGATVTVGEALGTITNGGAPAAPAQARKAEKPAARAEAPEAPEAATEAPAPQEEPLATPMARRIASEHGIELAQVQGSGPRGRITQEDVLAYLAAQRKEAPPAEAAPARAPEAKAPPAEAPRAPARPTPPPAAPGERREERVRLSRRRLTIARRLAEAHQTAVMTHTFNEADMSAVVELRRRHRESFRQRHGVDLGFMSFFVKAVIAALRQYPQLNAELQDDEVVYKYYYDIGIAVAAEEGLVVPVVRDADRRSFAEIEAAIADLAARTRERKLTLEELQGATFSITNGGVFGSLLSAPILNPPQVGILGMHRIIERPVAIGGQVVIRPMMYLALTYDHRIVDGREAVEFLVKVKEGVEDPARLLLDG